MGEIGLAMAILVGVFHKYSGKEGDKLTLSKSELKDLLKVEFEGMLSENDKMDRVFNDLDRNKDNCVDFQEYITLVATVTILCNSFFK